MTARALPWPTVHPFPARMAHDVVLNSLRNLRPGSTVLDPMCGSGTVLRAAISLGHTAIGSDVDPLAVLMAKVWTTPINRDHLERKALQLVRDAKRLNQDDVHLPWIDDDAETAGFVRYWFAPKQRRQLRRLAYLLVGPEGAAADVLRLALSRTIVTKDAGASLARDVSHSRPHKVFESTDFDVYEALLSSASRIANALANLPSGHRPRIRLADARRLDWVTTGSVSAIVTSPPYLNAIDYLRGHRLALVWLGHTCAELRQIRAGSVGAERSISADAMAVEADRILKPLTWVDSLGPRIKNMLRRYTVDLLALLGASHRVLKRDGCAVFVVGNSTLRGTYIENAAILRRAARTVGFRLARRYERELPPNKRYLPPPCTTTRSTLSARMRTETVLRFVRSLRHRD
jgi:tRNA G10  N-methylase Trm11